MNVFIFLNRAIRTFLVFILYTIRPLFGAAPCKFAVGCTAYAAHMLKNKPLWYAFYVISLRLLCCSPLYLLLPQKIYDSLHNPE
jgi:putative component of membrane protein insertase Oxa1/YidC/SpoIIIJ protein YidD